MAKTKSFLKEFKVFIARGNAMNLAIGVIIGSAFSAITNSLVGDIISPVIGIFTQADLSGLVLHLGAVEIRYGAFITAVINFLIIAFVVFLLVKLLNRLSTMGEKKKEDPAPTTQKCPYCKSEIDIAAVRCPFCTSEIATEQAGD